MLYKILSNLLIIKEKRMVSVLDYWHISIFNEVFTDIADWPVQFLYVKGWGEINKS